MDLWESASAMARAALPLCQAPAWGGPKRGQTAVKWWSNGGQTAVKQPPNNGQAAVKQRSNNGQMAVKRRSNSRQIAAKQWSNSGQTMVKRRSNGGRTMRQVERKRREYKEDLIRQMQVRHISHRKAAKRRSKGGQTVVKRWSKGDPLLPRRTRPARCRSVKNASGSEKTHQRRPCRRWLAMSGREP